MGRAKKIAPFKILLADRIQKNRKRIWDWHMQYAQIAPPPFYCSVDLRDSGHKIVPVDSNLYPAGFNNICPDDLRVAPAIVRAELDATAARLKRPAPKKILLIPEAHTANLHYLENLHYLKTILIDAGFEVQLGWYDERARDSNLPSDYDQAIELQSFTGKPIRAQRIRVTGDRLQVAGFDPDLVILNNDFSGGHPKVLDGLEQPILPPHFMGWHSRKKSTHFLHYNRLAAEFAQILEVDPWLIQVDTEEVSPVNFSEDEGLEEVAASVDRMVERIGQAYARHGIKEKPFVFVKNNAGTYGMGIMVCHSGDEVRSANRRTKNKMSVGKNKALIESVAIQEGVPTATIVDRLAAEPVIYLSGCELIGGFLRTNSERGRADNLNSQGMVFKKLCMRDLKHPSVSEDTEVDTSEADEDEPILELVYGAIARISAVATGLEIRDRLR
jgi:glutamate--cysteine ligase